MPGGSGLGRASLQLRFLKVGPEGVIALDSMAFGLEFPYGYSNAIDRDRILHSGDYVLEVHLFAKHGGEVQVTARIALSDETAIAASSWSRVKALYR